MTFTIQAKARERSRLKFNEPSMTEQQHAESCDIHNILKKYENLGMSPYALPDPSNYPDVSNNLDYHTASNMVAEAHSMFEELPSKLREQFDNDPIRMMDFMSQNPSNEDLIKLGLLIPEPNPIAGDPLERSLSDDTKNPPPPKEDQQNLPLEG
ncbi:internal scaffolding protein [Microviridae sp.]|nr:internal scaffolding protein [Microviridae sp.]